MDGFGIVMVIAIILSARLGVRLYGLHRKYKAEMKEEEEKENTKKEQ